MLHDLIMAAVGIQSVFPNPVESPATLFIAAGGMGTLVTSPDGINWTARNTFDSESIYSLGYDGSQFIYGNGTGKVKRSANGTVWSGGLQQVFTSSATYQVQDIAYGNGIIVAVSANGNIRTSPDGITWSVRNSGVSNGLLSVAFINGKFFITGSGGKILTSSDGINWTTATTPITININKIAYGNGVYLAACDSGTVLKSIDGNTWTIATSSLTFGITSILFANGWFVTGDSGGAFHKSFNGTSFVKQGIYFGGGIRINAMIHRNNLFIICGNNGRIQTSTDLTSITPRASNFDSLRNIECIISN